MDAATSTRFRIVIAEDHTLFRAGLSALLAREADIELVGEVDNGRDAIRAVGTHSPHLVLMDLSMPGTNGVEAIAEIKQRYPLTKVLVVTLHKTEEFIQEALRSGADGYILKSASPDELRVAIRSVLRGKVYVSPDVSEKIIHNYLSGGRGAQPFHTPWESLTVREREVLKLVAEGNSNKGIATYLSLSIKTVEKHRANLMRKLNMRNASTLTAYAIEKGLVET
jgi:DNA-binding NarL/FixJ family response regulator